MPTMVIAVAVAVAVAVSLLVLVAVRRRRDRLDEVDRFDEARRLTTGWSAHGVPSLVEAPLPQDASAQDASPPAG